MSSARGERVYFDLDESSLTGKAEAEGALTPPETTASGFFGDILERDFATASPPSAPTLKANTTGFPAHKKRTPRVSTFRQQRAAQKEATANVPSPPSQAKAQSNDAYTEAKQRPSSLTPEEDEKRLIDQENNERLSGMSQAEIEQEQQELLSSLSPSLIQRLLNRSTIDGGSNERELMPETAPPSTDDARPMFQSMSTKKVTFETPDTDPQEVTPEGTESSAPAVSAPLKASDLDQLPPSVHFPKPLPPAEPDPNSDTFLNDMHEKYFPDLPYDPSSVSWMKPIDPSDTTSPYHPSQTAMNPSELRFNFKGALLAPSAARNIPTTEGLHHHGEAPEAAGYTIPELARLSRSAVAPQRCIAYRTLGRILYRLGQGEFGVEEPVQRVDGPVGIVKDPNQMDEDEQEEWEEESVGSAMARGLWECIEEGRIIETMTEDAGRERGHLTARTYAQEALWNWRRGGGRKKKAV
ncbi:RPAP1-like protein [Lophiotrema nucula]|uniref:RPAP1-like protein n=1 Tax=Lophiotrema nucula TaxID=690887 RepID=A0A6A5ZSB0_9PLEO|nr:RPAP1-like protein [Lophiotrema nucula]